MRSFLLALALAACAPAPGGEGRGVLLITVDAWRADSAGLRGGHSPAGETLASRGGVVLEAAWAEHTDSRLSHAGLLSGTPAWVCQTEDPRDARLRSAALPRPWEAGEGGGVPALAEAFLGAGWATAAILGDRSLNELRGLERGFHDVLPAEAGSGVSHARKALSAWLARLPEHRDWFAWVHLADLDPRQASWLEELATAGAAEVLPVGLSPAAFHALPPTHASARAGFASSLPRVAAEELRQGYRAEAERLESEIGSLLDTGARATDEERLTASVVVGSTGLSLGEGGSWLRRSGLEPVDFHVPAWLTAPGLEAGTYGGLFALSDLAPTLLDLLGLSAEPGPTAEARLAMLGVSHAEALRGRDVVARSALPHPGTGSLWEGWEPGPFEELPVVVLGGDPVVLGIVDSFGSAVAARVNAGTAEELLGTRPPESAALPGGAEFLLPFGTTTAPRHTWRPLDGLPLELEERLSWAQREAQGAGLIERLEARREQAHGSPRRRP